LRASLSTYDSRDGQKKKRVEMHSKKKIEQFNARTFSNGHLKQLNIQIDCWKCKPWWWMWKCVDGWKNKLFFGVLLKQVVKVFAHIFFSTSHMPLATRLLMTLCVVDDSNTICLANTNRRWEDPLSLSLIKLKNCFSALMMKWGRKIFRFILWSG